VKPNDKYFKANKTIWEQKTAVHVASKFYDVPAFKSGWSSLRAVELEGVGDVRGKRLLHLQCHFGMDTLSWARLGAEATGVDFSADAIKYAKDLSREIDVPARFICSNVYDLKRMLKGKFDIVFVSYGCLGWLPDMGRWAEIVSHFLAPGGFLFLAEFHPVHWMLENGKVFYPYESGDEPLMFEPQGTYADRKAKIKGKEYWWNHGLGKIVTSLIEAGLTIESLREYPYSPYDAGNMVQREDGNWVNKKLGEKIPYMFSIKAGKGRD